MELEKTLSAGRVYYSFGSWERRIRSSRSSANFLSSKMEANSFIFAPMQRVPSYTSEASSAEGLPSPEDLKVPTNGVGGINDWVGVEARVGARGDNGGSRTSTTSSSATVEPSSKWGARASSRGVVACATPVILMWGFFTTTILSLAMVFFLANALQVIRWEFHIYKNLVANLVSEKSNIIPI